MKRLDRHLGEWGGRMSPARSVVAGEVETAELLDDVLDHLCDGLRVAYVCGERKRPTVAATQLVGKLAQCLGVCTIGVGRMLAQES